MPLDPFTGQQMPYGQEPMAPLPMRLMENAPGITAGVLFNARRGASTMLRGGGFLDNTRSARRAGKFGAFMGSDLNPTRSPSAFIGRNRSLFNAAGNMRDPWLRGARVNHLTMRPRAMGRLSSLSVFSQAESGLYSFAGGVRALGKMNVGPLKGLRSFVGAEAGDAILGPGLFAGISAGKKSIKLEKAAAGGSTRAAAKLQKLDMSIRRLATMNNPASMAPIMRSTNSHICAGIGSSCSRWPNSQSDSCAVRSSRKFSS